MAIVKTRCGQPAGIAQSVGCRALGCKVMGSNLPLSVTLGGHSGGSLTIPRCKITIMCK